tara:strand:+ start:362 stop:1096 length:735 start_codon:yes stop_codon:yes gene_type:complete
MIKNGILYFHQGWTDIINCLALINYYCKLYNKIYLIMREDAKELVNFYTKNIKNLEIFYEEKKNIDKDGIPFVVNNYKNLDIQDIDFLGIGGHDHLRNDKYKNAKKKTSSFFVTKFYTSYEIPYITRINDFTFNRNKELEQKKYNEFINKYGKKYILYHEVIENYDKNKKIVNLNGISNIFFDMIKVLENAIEIHLLDSVWGALIYQLDAKYKLFQSKKIILYAKRGYHAMFLSPVKLDNWIIK